MWQPIETAPERGVVDLFVSFPPNAAGVKGLRIPDCYRMKDGQWTSKSFNSEDRRVIRNPSHWMPLPEDPTI